MICGLKWKSCNCPWFNYEAVENDRLDHMQIPMPLRDHRPQRDRRAPDIRQPPRPPINYFDEIDRRRRQEREDEALARRLQTVTIEDDDDDDYNGVIGEVHGIANGAGHFMNQDYIRAAHTILTGVFDQGNAAANYVLGVNRERGVRPSPPAADPQDEISERHPAPPPVMLRRHTMREQAYNSAATTRPSERVVPRRTRTDYASEAARHAPVRRTPRRAATTRDPPRPSELAGLRGTGRGSGRVNAWRTYVEPGVVPAEGVLSV